VPAHIPPPDEYITSVKLANAAVDDVRRRVQRESPGHRGRNDVPLQGVRRLFTRGYERLSGSGWTRPSVAVNPTTRWVGFGPSKDSSPGSTRPKAQLRRGKRRIPDH
jgi:hypothetical protein